jgi:hypothetical protein
MKKKTKQKKITQSELARNLGISRQLVAAHIKKGDAPPLDDIEAWELHIVTHGREGGLLANATPELKEEYLREKLGLIKSQRRKIEVENLAREKELIDFQGSCQFIHKLIRVTVFGELDRIAQELPNLGETHRNKVEIHAELLKQIAIVRSAILKLVADWEASKGKA